MSEISLKPEEFSTWAQPLNAGPIIWAGKPEPTQREQLSFFLFSLSLCFFFNLPPFVATRGDWQEARLHYRIFVLTLWKTTSLLGTAEHASARPFLRNPGGFFRKRKLCPRSAFICPVCQCCSRRALVSCSVFFSSARALPRLALL